MRGTHVCKFSNNKLHLIYSQRVLSQFSKIKCQKIIVAFKIIRNRNNVPVVSPLTRCQSLLLGKKRSSYFHLIPTIKSTMEVVYEGQIRQNNFRGIAPTVRQLSSQHSPKLVVYLILKTCIQKTEKQIEWSFDIYKIDKSSI